MEYSFLYEFDKVPQEERKDRISQLSDEQLAVLKHVYLNKNMFDREQLRNEIREFEPTKPVNFLELIKYLDSDYEPVEASRMILNYLSDLSKTHGCLEASKAAKVIFCKKRIVGVKAIHVKCELEFRELFKK